MIISLTYLLMASTSLSSVVPVRSRPRCPSAQAETGMPGLMVAESGMQRI